MRRPLLNLLLPAAAGVAFLGCWQAVHLSLSEDSRFLLPSPGAVGQAMLDHRATLLRATLNTAEGALAGFGLAVVVSTLISVLSAARPRIADYPFTTLVPNLGVVRKPSGDGTVFADIPGLIEGAAQGAGLGHDFLRHIERTRLLIHLVDAGGEDLLADVAVVEGELQAYGHGLAERPRLLVLNKIELLEASELESVLQQLQDHARSQRLLATLAISAATGEGLERLKAAVWAQLEAAAAEAPAATQVISVEPVARPRERPLS